MAADGHARVHVAGAVQDCLVATDLPTAGYPTIGIVLALNANIQLT